MSADRCDDFRFTAERWREARSRDGSEDDVQRMAEAIVACRTLEGRTRSETGELLGRTDDMQDPTWTYPLGTVNDLIGPGDGKALYVHFGGDGRVRRADLLEP